MQASANGVNIAGGVRRRDRGARGPV